MSKSPKEQIQLLRNSRRDLLIERDTLNVTVVNQAATIKDLKSYITDANRLIDKLLFRSERLSGIEHRGEELALMILNKDRVK